MCCKQPQGSWGPAHGTAGSPTDTLLGDGEQTPQNFLQELRFGELGQEGDNTRDRRS